MLFLSVVKKEMTPFEISIIFGAMAGWAGVFILIYKSKMDKPKLEFEEESKMFYPAEGNNPFTVIVIRFKAHNQGTKSTTIYHTKLSFTFNLKKHETESTSSIDIPPSSTVDFYSNLAIHSSDLILRDKITDCVLTVKHTFGKKVHNLRTIEQLKK